MNKARFLNTGNYLPLSVFVRFYMVGFFLFILPFTRGFFVNITGLSLLLVFGFVFVFHSSWNVKTVAWFLFIIISSFMVEMVGVSTGTIFGTYQYDKGLGWQYNHTPLIIGLNWLFLVYASHGIAGSITHKKWLIVLTGALLMVGYDLLLEWVAPPMQMWHFEEGYPPFANFMVWFGLGLIYHAGFELLHISSRNKFAGSLFIIQLFFFCCIGLYSFFFIR